MTTPTVHHPCSPSRLDRIAACPGSVTATARAMEDYDWDNAESSEAAKEGTMLHAVMANTAPEAVLTPEQAELIQGARNYLRLHFADVPDLTIEKRICLVGEHWNVITEGTADVIGLTKDGTLKVLDWKFGRKWVSPDSLQLKAYAAAAWQFYGLNNVKCVEAHIYQPRAGEGKPTMFTNFDDIFTAVKTVVDAAWSPYAPLAPGSHCTYCPARVDCSAAMNLETAVVRADSGGLLADPVRLGQAAEVAQYVVKRCEQILAMCKEQTLAGQPTGWKILERAGRRSVDVRLAFERLQPLLSWEDFAALLTVPYGSLQKIVTGKLKSTEGYSGKQSEAWLEQALGDAISTGKPSQVMVVDKAQKEIPEQGRKE